MITPQQIKNTITIFSHAKHHITLTLTKTLNDYIELHGENFDFNQLFSNYINLSTSPNEAIYNFWKKTFIENIETNTANDLHYALWLHEKLSIIPNEDFLCAWIARAHSIISTFSPSTALGSLWALSTLEFNSKINDHIDINTIKLTLKNQLTSTNILLLNPEAQHKLLTTDYLNNNTILTDDQRQRIIETHRTKLPTHSELQTKAFKKLFPTFKSKIGFEEEAWISTLAIRVDGYIASKNLIIQIDGNNHFTNHFNGEPRQDFQTELNTKLLESLGYNVIRISTYDMAKKGWEAQYIEQINMIAEDFPTIRLDESTYTTTDHETSEGSDTASIDGEVSISELMRTLSNEESEIDLLGIHN